SRFRPVSARADCRSDYRSLGGIEATGACFRSRTLSSRRRVMGSDGRSFSACEPLSRGARRPSPVASSTARFLGAELFLGATFVFGGWTSRGTIDLTDRAEVVGEMCDAAGDPTQFAAAQLARFRERVDPCLGFAT